MNNVRADLSAIERRVKSIDEPLDSPAFKECCRAVDAFLVAAGSNGATMPQIANAVGRQNDHWLHVAINLAGVRESWKLPTRYIKLEKSPFLDDGPHTWGETNQNLFKDECVGYAGAY